MDKSRSQARLKENEYQCACCGGAFEYGWSDELASKELEQNFPGYEKQDCAVICDDCYRETGLFYGPPEDPLKEVPKYMREIMRSHFDKVAAEISKALEDNLLWGTPLPEPTFTSSRAERGGSKSP